MSQLIRPSSARGKTPHVSEEWALLAFTAGLIPAAVLLATLWLDDSDRSAAWITFGLTAVLLVWAWRLTVCSVRWTVRHKVLAGVGLPFPFGGALFAMVYVATHFSIQDEDVEYSPPWEVALTWLAFLMSLIVPIVLAFHLAVVARRAAARTSSEAGSPSNCND